jgi:hypothetical protein
VFALTSLSQEAVYLVCIIRPQLYTVKKSFSTFPSPARMSLTKLSLVGNYDVTYKLFLTRESLLSDIPAGDGNIKKLFYGVGLFGQ